MVAAAGTGVAAVEHEFLRREPGQPRLVVQNGRIGHQFIPASRRMDVDFDDAGIRRDIQHFDPCIGGGRITFDRNGHAQFARRFLQRGDQREIVLEIRQRRHEYMELRLTHFDAQRGTNDLIGRGVWGRWVRAHGDVF